MPEHSGHYDINRQKYRWFAENRRRSEREIDEDFEGLIADPHLVALDFMAHDPKILMLQTPIIDIPYQGDVHRIGAFIIFISRRFIERSWQVQVRFKNVHGMLFPGNNRAQVHHPHISNEVDNAEFVPNVGYFCTNAFGTLEKPLKDGRIFDAYPIFLEILTLYNEAWPFFPIENWPVVEEAAAQKGT